MEQLVLVRILTQFFENYTCDVSSPHWKPKSKVEFFVRVPFDFLMYEEERCVQAFIKCLQEKENSMCRFKYLSFEPVFHEPIELETEQFNRLFHTTQDIA